MSVGVLEEVKKAARYGQVITTNHSRERMEDRHVPAEDVAHAIATAKLAIDQPTEKRSDWKEVGTAMATH